MNTDNSARPLRELERDLHRILRRARILNWLSALSLPALAAATVIVQFGSEQKWLLAVVGLAAFASGVISRLLSARYSARVLRELERFAKTTEHTSAEYDELRRIINKLTKSGPM